MRLYAGTPEGLVSVGEDGLELEPALKGTDVTALAPDGSWGVVGGRELWRRNGDWRRVGQVEGLKARCVLSGGGSVWIGTSDARLVRSDGDDMRPSAAFDAAEGRDSWYTPWGGPPDTRSLSVSSDGTLYANVHVGGILRSLDEGETWTPTIDVDADVHQVLAHPTEPEIVLAATAYGLAMSEDRGETWRTDNEGLHASYCRAAAVAGDSTLVTASTGPFTHRAAVYSRIGAGPFVRCETGLPEWFGSNIDTGCLVANGSDAAIGTDDGEIYVSNDAGETWRLMADGLSPIRWLAVAS